MNILREGPPKLPIGESVEKLVLYLRSTFGTFFDTVSDAIEFVASSLSGFLFFLPAPVLILLTLLLAWRLKGRQIVPLTFFLLVLLYSIDLWEESMQTVALVLTAALIALSIGIPMGILVGRNKYARHIVRPILDFMQTLPSFVYLIPAVILFGLGQTSGIVATVIFSTAPSIRLTALGIQQVRDDLIEAGNAFGATPFQTLWKVQLPLARPSIMAGINQTTMLALAMTVIASMIGAGGLGSEVLGAIQRVDIAHGVDSGLAIVLVAMLLDRLIQTSATKRPRRSPVSSEKIQEKAGNVG
jgi:glycine betaine/proline transport system permease protein